MVFVIFCYSKVQAEDEVMQQDNAENVNKAPGKMAEMSWLEDLHKHPIFESPSLSTSSSRDEGFHGRQGVMTVVRQTELWVAIGKEIRITSLIDWKSKCEGKDWHTASYKVSGL